MPDTTPHPAPSSTGSAPAGPGSTSDQPAGSIGSTPRNPGDEAPAGQPGTGENVCPQCGGSGRVGATACPNCGGLGKIVSIVGGA